jgi:aspartyl-tRNA(Asn)/glutamyl-tRNA(Gln) amidotransferase subunit A
MRYQCCILVCRYDGIEFGYRADERRSSDELYAKSRSESLNEIVRRRILAGNYFLLKELSFVFEH